MCRGAYPLFMDQVAPQTRLLEKRRQMFEVQEKLDTRKDEFARREVSNGCPHQQCCAGVWDICGKQRD